LNAIFISLHKESTYSGKAIARKI